MQIDDLLNEAKSVAIFGHVRPDGDCVGSTLGLYNYISDNYPTIKVRIFLERFPENYKILANANETYEYYNEEFGDFDLTFIMDVPTIERIGAKIIGNVASAGNLLLVARELISDNLDNLRFNLFPISSHCEPFRKSFLSVRNFQRENLDQSKACLSKRYLRRR